MADELSTKRIINLPAESGPAEGDVFVVDNESTGTKKLPISGLIDPTLSQSGQAADAKVVGDEITGLKEDLSAISVPLNTNQKTVVSTKIVNLEWIEGSYYNLTTGEITANASLARTDKMSCKEGDVFIIPELAGQIVFFMSDGTVSYKSGAQTYETIRSAPANCTHYAFNNNNSAIRNTHVQVRTATEEIIENTLTAPAKQICDSDKFVNRVYASTSNGRLYYGDAYATWYCLSFWPVKSSHKYRTSNKTQVIFYDSQMTLISAILPGGEAKNTGTTVEMDFETPSNCKFVSINTLKSNEMLFDLEYTVSGFILNPQKLTGLKILSFGDSITGNYSFGDNISSQVEKFNGAKTYNCGFGGCRMELLAGDSEVAQITNPFAMCSIVDELAKPDSDNTKWSAQDAAAATFEASPRFNRIIKFRLEILKTVDISMIDIVTIAYGTNEIGFVQENSEDKYDKYTFGGATRYSIEKLLELNPKLQIVLLTPIYRHDVSSTGLDSDHYVSSHGLSMVDNINTLKTVGLEYKMPVIDMYHDLGINVQNYLSYFGDDDESDDGTHINTYGRKRYGERLAGELNRLF